MPRAQMPTWVLIALLGGACVGPAAEPAAGGLERVRAAGVLRWGGDVQGGEPYVFEDPKRPGERVGFEVEIADSLAAALGVRAEFVQNDWSLLVPTLERGTIDIILNGLEVTESRRQRIRLSRPYYRFSERLTARTGDRRLSDLASLAGKRVGTLAGSLAWDLLEQAGAQRISYEGVEEPYRDLVSGRLDAVLMDDIIADRYGRRAGLTAVGDVARGEYAIGLRKTDATLADAIDVALSRLETSGELSAILRKWRLESSVPGLTSDTTPLPVRSGRLTVQHVVLFWKGAATTLLISMGAMLIAISLGLALALARFDRLSARRGWRRLLAGLATTYVEVFRGTPALLQLYVLYFGLAPIYPLHPLVAAILGLGLNYAAYEAEIYRAGLQAVPRGQIEAAEALGMSSRLVLRRVLLPQAFRFSLPGVANDFIALLKDSALVSVITVVELTKRMTIVAVDSGGWLAPGLLCAALYLVMSYPLSRLARRLERVLAPRS